MVEYCMLEGVNDSIETAHLLGKLLQDRSVHVNLIPYNTTEVDAQFRSPSPEAIRAFHSVLRDPYNLKATIRENHGTDIDGACGQLALKNKTEAAGVPQNRDIEDLGRRPSPSASSPKKKQKAAQKLSSRSEWLDSVGEFVADHQQTIGYSLLIASVLVFALGALRRH
jgi:hypothetical protein